MLMELTALVQFDIWPFLLMMGGYLVYFKGKLIGDVCGDELFLKRTPISDRLLADSELRYPYEGSKTLMHGI